MIPQHVRFPILIAVSLLVFVAILWFVLRKRDPHASYVGMAVVAIVVVIGGMLFAKTMQNAGVPWWVYYLVPASITLLLPPLAFRMAWPELWRYVVLAFLSAPAIHVAFSFFLGWHDYLPFLHVPSLQSLFG